MARIISCLRAHEETVVHAQESKVYFKVHARTNNQIDIDDALSAMLALCYSLGEQFLFTRLSGIIAK
jgi:hypothetical protein